MKRLGWEQVFDSTDDAYKLKWVQCGRSINWNSFREGTKKTKSQLGTLLNKYSTNAVELFKCRNVIYWNSKGEQMVNHIPNCSLFTNKLNLLCSLQAFEKTQLQNANRLPIFMPLEEYVPLTFKLDYQIEKDLFFQTAKSMFLFFLSIVDTIDFIHC